MHDHPKIRTEEMLKGNLIEPVDFPPRAEIRELIIVEHRVECGTKVHLIYEKDGRLIAVSDPRQQRDYSK